MEHTMYYGPQKTPFGILNEDKVDSDSAIPFHGIISRGLLQKCIDVQTGNDLWHNYAHRLYHNKAGKSPKALNKMYEYMCECEVASFGQSAYAANKYVEQYCTENKKENEHLELWNIKEGHTSSVWKVTVGSGKNSEVFAVNVARDREAGRELKASSRKLKTIGDKIPGINCAKVYDISAVHHNILPGPVIVTRNEWVDNAFEIHSRLNRQTGRQELLMVERFLTDTNNPARITSVLGRKFTAEETAKIKKEIDEFEVKATHLLSEKIEPCINDGDAVWNGQKTVVIAIN